MWLSLRHVTPPHLPQLLIEQNDSSQQQTSQAGVRMSCWMVSARANLFAKPEGSVLWLFEVLLSPATVRKLISCNGECKSFLLPLVWQRGFSCMPALPIRSSNKNNVTVLNSCQHQHQQISNRYIYLGIQFRNWSTDRWPTEKRFYITSGSGLLTLIIINNLFLLKYFSSRRMPQWRSVCGNIDRGR